MQALAALIPSIGVGFLFYLAIRAIINADRRERAAMAELDRAERERATRGTSNAANADSPTTSAESPAGHAVQSSGDNSKSSA